jgi:transcriptional regulator with XRE-family HTH domain
VLVAAKQYLSPEFREWLLTLIKAKGFTPNGLAIESQVDPSHLGKILRGVVHPSEPVLRAIAPKLGLSPSGLEVRAQVDLIGGIERLRQEMPEAFGPPDPLEAIRPALSDLERPVVRRMMELNGGTLEGLNLNEWELLGVDRLAFFKDRLAGLERVSKSKKVKKVEEA